MPEPLPLWKLWSDRASHAALRCDDLPDRCESKEDWQDTLRDIGRNIHVTGRVAADQMRAVENIEEAIAKWLDR